MSAISSVLIVGAGQAAAVAAAALRDHGYTGAICIVGDELHAPYERPPLSKKILAAVASDEPAIHIKDADFFAHNNIDLRLGVQVVELNVAARQAVLSDGSSLSFDRCLLATGGAARLLPQLPPSSPFVHYLRTLDDAKRLRSSLARSERTVIIGGGFLGLEIASTARAMGVQTTVIETADRVLARAVPEAFSNWLQERVTRLGVALHLGQPIQDIQLPDNDVSLATITLANGVALHADTIVIAIGLTPNTAVAQAAGLELDPNNAGIVVDEQCRTSAAGIYAAGDCTSQKRDGQATTIRLESWQNANEQARIAAAALLGQPVAPAALPWFWTDQFGCNIQMLGLPQAGLHYIVRGDNDPQSEAPNFMMLGLRDGKPHHALAVNAGGDLRAMRPILERTLPINPDEFTHTATTVRAFAKAVVAKAKSVA